MSAIEGQNPVPADGFSECRICLLKIEMSWTVKLLQPWPTSWDGMKCTVAEDLYSLANIQITHKDLYSKVICLNCCEKLRNACEIVRLAQKNNNKILTRRNPKIEMDVSSESVWPKPIQLDKSVAECLFENSMDIEVKQELLSDSEELNTTEFKDDYSNAEIKIEPEEITIPDLSTNIRLEACSIPLSNYEQMNGATNGICYDEETKEQHNSNDNLLSHSDCKIEDVQIKYEIDSDKYIDIEHENKLFDCESKHTNTEHEATVRANNSTNTREKKFRKQDMPDEIKNLKTPIELFRYMMTPEIISNIAKETNRYALEILGKNIALTNEEVQTYIGIVIYKRVIRFNKVENYWNSNSGTGTEDFTLINNAMSYQRYKEIKKYLRLTTTEEKRPKSSSEYDALQQMGPFLGKIRERLQLLPEEYERCIDEVFVSVPNDNAQLLKTLTLSNMSGLIRDFEIYADNDDVDYDSLILKLLKSALVYYDSCALYLDNRFTNLPLIAKLFKLNIHVIASIDEDLVQDVIPSDNEMVRGSTVETTITVDDVKIRLVSWLDKKLRHFAFTYFGKLLEVNLQRFNKEKKELVYITCPNVAYKLNNCGNKLDSLSLYRDYIATKYINTEPFHALFFHVIHLLCNNTFILHWEVNRTSMKSTQFFIRLAESLILDGKLILFRINDEKFFTFKGEIGKYHFPETQTIRKICVVCQNKTSTKCTNCMKYFCIDREKNCFNEFHKNVVIANSEIKDTKILCLDRNIKKKIDFPEVLKNSGNFKWKEEVLAKNLRLYPFLGDNENIPKELKNAYGPIAFFLFMFTPQIMHSMFPDNKNVKVSTNELLKVIGILLYMSVYRLHHNPLYWSTTHDFKLIRNSMTYDKFCEIMKMLTLFRRRSVKLENFDALERIKPLLSTVRQRLVLLPKTDNLVIDEHRTSAKERNLKTIVLRSVSGVIYDFDIVDFAQKTTEHIRSDIVMRLCNSVPKHVNHKLYFDNRLASLPLLARLHKNGILPLCVLNYNVIPQNDFIKEDIGYSTEKVINVDNVSITVVPWVSDEVIYFASTFAGKYPETKVQTFNSRKTKQINCPKVLELYLNNCDRKSNFDTILGEHRIGIPDFKWKHTIFYYLIDMISVNSWLLWQQVHHEATFVEFRMKLAQDLLKRSSDLSLSEPASRRRPVILPPSEVRYDGVGHYPQREERYRRCENPGCYGTSSIRCLKCDLHLCITKSRGCFDNFHKPNIYYRLK